MTTTSLIGAIRVAAGMTMTAGGEATAVGSATPRVTRKRLGADGSDPIMARADGSATARVTPKPPAAGGSVPTMAIAAGMAIPRAIPRRRAAGGRTDIDRNVATMTTEAAATAEMTMNIAAMTIIARLLAAVDTAVGRATPRAIPRLRVAVGKTVVKPAVANGSRFQTFNLPLASAGGSHHLELSCLRPKQRGSKSSSPTPLRISISRE